MDIKNWKSIKMNTNAYEKLIEPQYYLFQKTERKMLDDNDTLKNKYNKLLIEENMNINLDTLLKKYEIKDMNDWDGVNADLIITDPPFGIKFSGKKQNYHRKSEYVVDGYIEWDVEEYDKLISQLLMVIYKNLKPSGQALLFSGWNNSGIVSNEINKFKKLKLNGKLYWIYNFAPACKRRPAHNVYEIFWLSKTNKYTYHNRCNTDHCLNGEPNLSSFIFKRDYKKEMPKYPTRLPYNLLKSLIEHFSNENDLIFDPLAGSGMVGIASFLNNRDFLLGDLNPNGKLVYKNLLIYYINNYEKIEGLKKKQKFLKL
jgi:DNA modification methylase